MIEYFVILVLVIVFTIASYEDIKKREVYDYINYSFIFTILLISIIYSLQIQSLDFMIKVLLGSFFGFVLGFLLYLTGLWGGGDAKFMIGFGAATPYLILFNDVFLSKYFVRGFFISYQNIEIVINYFSYLVLFLNLLFLSTIVWKFFYRRKREEFRDLGILSFTFLLLIASFFLSSNIQVFSILIFAFISVVFFSDDKILKVLYYIKKVPITQLREGDVLEDSLKYKNRVILKKRDATDGLSSEELNEINSFDNVTMDVEKRIIFPIGYVLALNFLLILLTLLIADLDIFKLFLYNFSYLFLSFVVGGVIAVGVLFYTYIRNITKIKVTFSNFDKFYMICIFITSAVISYFNWSFLFAGIVFSLLIPFLKIAKQTEKYLFVSQKNIDDVVPGDWVVEDIVVNDKIVYKTEEMKLGIDEKQISRIRKLSSQNKDFTTITVKDGLAFLPPLFIGFFVFLIL